MKYNLNLPKTSFPLKSKPQVQSSFLPAVMTPYEQRDETFVLHDGPPYANGHLHLGHVLNKVTKDLFNRHQYFMHGKYPDFRPGWDCHGLPIELKVEEQYKKQGLDKSTDPVAFRKDCRLYAESWVATQQAEFQALGVLADWDNKYLTQNAEFEAETLSNLYKLKDKNLLVKKFKPVWWSPVEKTTLAEAELEYENMKMDSLFVEFPVEGENYSVLVWTTSPWTLPGNQAVAFHPDSDLVVVTQNSVDSVKTFVVSRQLYNACYGMLNLELVGPFDTSELSGKKVLPPFSNQSTPLLTADFVDPRVGAGFVHVVPGHGMDDFQLGVQHGLNLESLVDDDGLMEVDGKLVHVYKATKEVLALLDQSKLFSYYNGESNHTYPVSWRSKAPLVVKTKINWFMDLEPVLEGAMDQVMNHVDWHDDALLNRMSSMLGNRTDWCLSRQRLWGVPLALFVDKNTNELLNDQEVDAYVVNLFRQHTSDVWYQHDADYFLPEKYHGQYEKVMDVLDVWFDSGSSFKAVFPDLEQSDLVVEGTDQHRGWFQSSMLVHYALYGKSPYKAVVTHGFVKKHSNKLSKSRSNADSLETVLAKYGPDVLRYWVASSRVTQDVEMSDSRLDQAEKSYDKVRNTVRFCLSNLENVPVNYNAELRPLDRWVLKKLNDVVEKFKFGMFDFGMTKELELYCFWVSSFYFPTVKDTLYCDTLDNPKRQAAVLTMDKILKALLALTQIVLPFMVEEVKVLGFNPEFCLDTVDYSNLGYWQFVEEELEYMKKCFEVERVSRGWYMENTVFRYHSLLPVDWKELLGCAEFVNNPEPQYLNMDSFDGVKCPRCRNYFHMETEHCDRCSEIENDLDSSCNTG